MYPICNGFTVTDRLDYRCSVLNFSFCKLGSDILQYSTGHLSSARLDALMSVSAKNCRITFSVSEWGVCECMCVILHYFLIGLSVVKLCGSSADCSVQSLTHTLTEICVTIRNPQRLRISHRHTPLIRPLTLKRCTRWSRIALFLHPFLVFSKWPIYINICFEVSTHKNVAGQVEI